MKRLFMSLTVMGCLLTANAQEALQRMEQEAKALIAQMTLKEKFSQMMNETPGIKRLGIEPYDWWNEGLHGVGRNGRATVFPQPIGLAATFHPELISQIGDAIAMEARAKYAIARRNGNYARYNEDIKQMAWYETVGGI